jgi:hypothetical protein
MMMEKIGYAFSIKFVLPKVHRPCHF